VAEALARSEAAWRTVAPAGDGPEAMLRHGRRVWHLIRGAEDLGPAAPNHPVAVPDGIVMNDDIAAGTSADFDRARPEREAPEALASVVEYQHVHLLPSALPYRQRAASVAC